MNNERKIAGHVKEVSSLSNPIIKAIKALHLKKNRDAEGLFISRPQAVELGPLHVST